MGGEGRPDLLDVVDKVLRVAIGHVQADELHVGQGIEDLGQPLEVAVGRAGAAGGEGDGRGVVLGELEPLLGRVVLVDARVAAVL